MLEATKTRIKEHFDVLDDIFDKYDNSTTVHAVDCDCQSIFGPDWRCN